MKLILLALAKPLFGSTLILYPLGMKGSEELLIPEQPLLQEKIEIVPRDDIREQIRPIPNPGGVQPDEPALPAEPEE